MAQEHKDIQAKEEKRREALMPNQPTPIPELEEGEEKGEEKETGEVEQGGGGGEADEKTAES